MTDITDALLDELKNAFPAKRRRFMPLGRGDPRGEAGYVDRDFADKDDWTELEPEWLHCIPNNLSSALCFMCDEAQRFYIPAYIAADLAGKPTEEDPVFHLCHDFDDQWRTRRDSRNQKESYDRGAQWADLSPPQVAAVVHYLEWKLASKGPIAGGAILEALESYWYERLAEAGVEFRTLRNSERRAEMNAVGYMSKKVVSGADALADVGIEDICSVSGCISKFFADYINHWRHNRYWFFNLAADLDDLCRQEKIDISANTLFFYEVFERQYDADHRTWEIFDPDAPMQTSVMHPAKAMLLGFDVTTFSAGTSPECSPLSCNSLADEIAVNRHCLFDTFDQAVEALEAGKFGNSEPGPFRIFAVYRVEA